MTKVALLLYGQPRFVDRMEVFYSHKKDIISKYETDVYCQMWYDPDGEYENLSSWAAEKAGFDKPKIPLNAPMLVSEMYRPVSMRIDRPLLEVDFEPDVEEYLVERWKGNEFFSIGNMKNIVSQLAAIDYVWDLAVSPYYWDYDYFVLARYDAVLDRFPENLEELDRKKFYLPEGGHFNDLVHVFGGEFVDDYGDYDTKSSPFCYWKDMMIHQYVHGDVELPIPELYKLSMFQRSDYPESTLTKHPMYAHVIRK